MKRVSYSHLKHVVICFTGGAGFPKGTAGSNRVRLIARGLIEQGYSVRVLIPGASELPSFVENTDLCGGIDGIDFEYTTLTTVVFRNSFKRRYVAYLGRIKILLRLLQLKLEGQLDIIYLYPIISHRLEPMRFIIASLARVLSVPVVMEFVEWVWSMKPQKTFLEKHLSPLYGISGVVAISEFLETWTRVEANSKGINIPTMRMPILANISETLKIGEPSNTSIVLYSGTPGYIDTIKFVLESMKEVWALEPKCKLVITGCRPDDPKAAWLFDKVANTQFNGKVELVGYVSRERLLELYGQAWVHLIPLFDDFKSQARFPTKIAEYLSSGKPVVTNAVGEVKSYLQDGVNAFICSPGVPKLYGQKIVEAINSYREGNNVGHCGRIVAEQNFHYACHSEGLASFLQKLMTIYK